MRKKNNEKYFHKFKDISSNNYQITVDCMMESLTLLSITQLGTNLL